MADLEHVITLGGREYSEAYIPAQMVWECEQLGDTWAAAFWIGEGVFGLC